jgi:hypothetical protein
MSSNYATVIVDSATSQLRYIAPIHQFQNWGPNQNPSIPLNKMMSQSNSCNVMTITNNNIGIGTTTPSATCCCKYNKSHFYDCFRWCR